MKVTAIIQARMGSTRLSDKMTLEICGKTILEHVILRIKKCKNVDNIVVATSTKKENDIIEKISRKVNVDVFRGSEDNVLQRFKEAADKFGGDVIIRICADSPLIDHKIIDKAVEKFLEIKPDYLTTTIKRTFPEGLDVEVFSKKTLDKVYELAKEKDDLEHVTFYIRKNQNLFNCYNLEAPEEFRYPEIKLTLDTQDDFLFIKSIFESLYIENKFFDTKDMIDFLNKRKKIMIRVDGSNKLGMGDVISMLNLAINLKNFQILFISKFDEGIDKIKKSGYNVERMPDVNLDEEIEIIKKINGKFKADMIITELFRNDYQDYYRKLSYLTKTMVLDLFGGIEIYSDILVNWNLLSESHKYIKKRENTVYCLGPKYTLLKENFGNYHDKKKIINENVKNILITMGGADTRNLTPKIINALKDFKKINFNVTVGFAYKNKNEIKMVLDANNINYNLIENMDDLSKIMYDVDLVICGGGLTCFELCAIGTPFIGVSNIDWELGRLIKMKEMRICEYAGNWKDFNQKELRNIFKDLLNNKSKREEMSVNGKNLLDGKGAVKIARIIKEVIEDGNKTNNKY